MTQNKIRNFYTLSPYITKCCKNKSSCEITIIIHLSANRSKTSTELNAFQCSYDKKVFFRWTFYGLEDRNSYTATAYKKFILLEISICLMVH